MTTCFSICSHACMLFHMVAHMLLHAFAYMHALNVSTHAFLCSHACTPCSDMCFSPCVLTCLSTCSHTQHIHTSPYVLIHMCPMSSHMYASPCVPYMHASLFTCMCSHICMLAHDRAHVSSSATLTPCWAVVQAPTNPKTALSYVARECGPGVHQGGKGDAEAQVSQETLVTQVTPGHSS